MAFQITINTENAAFKEDYVGEILRILHQVRSDLSSYGPLYFEGRNGQGKPIHDINGNSTGYVRFIPDETKELA